jgi:D-glycero-D-manno-heptose 1,7-bisphosphate phosphatase
MLQTPMKPHSNHQQPTFFFDRDGIINQRIIDGYVTDVDEFVLLREVFPLFRFAKEHGFLAIVITNQQGVGKGLMTEDDLARIHAVMQEEFQRETGSCFDDIFVATERDMSSRSGCCGDIMAQSRRKPSPAMLLEAAKKWNVNLAASWMIGDSLSDAEAGRAAGTSTILVGDFSDDVVRTHPADIIVPSLKAALHALQEKFLTESVFVRDAG